MWADLRSDNIFAANYQTKPIPDDPETMRQKVMQRSPEERCEFFFNAFVNIKSFTSGLQFINAMIDRAKHTKHPGGLWIIGDGGSGKSFLLGRIYEKYPPIETPTSREVPLISIELRERPYISDLIIYMLAALGQDTELIRYKNNAELEDILISAITVSKTLAVLFDEAQHLWITSYKSRQSDRAAGQVGEFLKRLYNRVGCAYVFAGTSGLEEVAKRESQSSTRWSGRLKLDDFQFNTDFLGLLNALDRMAPMPERANLNEPSLARRLHMATHGNFRLLKRLLAEAVLIAARQGATCITIEHLEAAHFLTFCDAFNPFQE